MEAAPIKEMKDSVHGKEGHRILPVAVIFGANSSGKSNLVLALHSMVSMVRNSVKLNPSDKLSQDPFMLDESSFKESTSFEIQFIDNDTIFRYGFEYFTDRIEKEWLFRKIPGKKEHYLFLRENDDIGINKAYFKEGAGKEGATPSNRLFLSLVAQLNGSISQTVLSWFDSVEIILGNTDTSYFEANTIDMITRNEAWKEAAIGFLKSASLGFDDITVVDDDEKQLTNQSPIFSSKGIGGKRLMTRHNVYNSNGDVSRTILFDKKDKESEGTKKLINLSGPLFSILSKGSVLIVDELDAKMHPMLTKKIINLFTSKKTNPNGAQLILTTQDTTLLDISILRRDEIWFTEKDRTDCSSLYALSEFREPDGAKVRNDRSFAKDYLNGRYGGIPLFY